MPEKIYSRQDIEKSREKIREKLKGSNLEKELNRFDQELRSKGFSDAVRDAVQDAWKEYIDLVLFGDNKSVRLEIVDINEDS